MTASFRLTTATLLSIGVVACSSVTRPDEPELADAADPKGDGGIRNGGMNEGSVRDAAAADAGRDTFELEIAVANRHGRVVDGVRVRVDAADGTVVEGEGDAEGRFVAVLERQSAPWDVTVAREGYNSATTILGVTGPIANPIHLSGPVAGEMAEATNISGLVTGLSAGDGVSMQLVGPSVAETSFSRIGNTYMATLSDGRATASSRIMALEVIEGLEAPTNGLWVDVDRASDLTMVDVAFPTPAPRTARSLTIELPTQGALDASRYALNTGIAYLVADDFEFETGTVGAVSAGAGTFDCMIDALGGEVAPTDVRLDFVADDGEVIVEASADREGSVALEPAEVLSATGDSFETLRISMSGSSYGHTGASVSGSRATWFVYSYGPGAVEDLPWPRLPMGMQFADLDSIGARSGKVNVFVLTREDGSQPWDWGRVHRERALIKSQPLTLSGR